jgi:hypothetical protein
VRRRCRCREDIRASEGHLAARCLNTGEAGEIIFDADLLERVPLQELPIRVAEMQTLSPKTLDFSTGHEYGHGPPSTCQFDVNTRLRLVNKAGKSGPRFSD